SARRSSSTAASAATSPSRWASTPATTPARGTRSGSRCPRRASTSSTRPAACASDGLPKGAHVSLTGLHHVGLAVTSLDRSVDWYSRFLQAPPVLRKVWDVEYIARMLRIPGVEIECAFWKLPGGTTLELIEYREPRPGTVDMGTHNAGNGHLCL